VRCLVPKILKSRARLDSLGGLFVYRKMILEFFFSFKDLF
jgi:hypothetical protein